MLDRMGQVLLVACLLGFATPARGQFASAKQYAVGLSPTRLAIGDMTNDGAPDLVVSNLGTPQGIKILRNDGHGAFQEIVFLYPGALNPSDIDLADLDGNGFLDIVMADPGVSVLKGSGTTIFSPLITSPLGWPASALSVVDATGDGELDVIAIGPNDAALLVGKGDGTFEAPWLPITIGGNPGGIAVGDPNEDGIPDFATLLSNTDEVAVLFGLGGGAFGAPVPFTAGTDPSGVTFGEVNGDGHQDLVVTNFASHDVIRFLGDGSGAFSAAVPLASQNSPIAPIVADFTADGIADIAAVNIFASSVSLFTGQGGGSFSSQILIPTGGTHAYDMARADLDLSGFSDLAIVNSSSNSVSVLLAAPTVCSGSTASSQSVRLGTPRNPPALQPDAAHGPILGLAWKLTMSHETFVTNALLDFLIIGISPLNAPTASGTLLVDITKPHVILQGSPLESFTLQIPTMCVLVGVPLYAQGLSLSFTQKALTNAIDATIGVL